MEVDTNPFDRRLCQCFNYIIDGYFLCSLCPTNDTRTYIDEPSEFTGVGPCVWRTHGHRSTKSVHWGLSLCPADTGASANQTSSLESALVSPRHRGINKPNQFTGVGPCALPTQGHKSTKPVHWGRSLCSADTRTSVNRTSSLGSVLVSRGHKGIEQPNQLIVVVLRVSRRTQGHRVHFPERQVGVPRLVPYNTAWLIISVVGIRYDMECSYKKVCGGGDTEADATVLENAGGFMSPCQILK